MDERSLLLSFASKIFAKTDEELASLLYKEDALTDNAFDSLLKLDTERVSRIKKTSGTELFDNGHKKGTKEAMENFEKDFKAKTGFESDLTGLDLVLGWGSAQQTVKDDTIKTHPTFLSAEKSWKEKYDSDLNKAKSEFEGFKSQVERERKFSTVKSKAREVFMGLNPILSENPAKADRQVNNFLGNLQGYDFQDQDNQMLILRDGRRLEDDHGNPLPFDKFITKEAEQIFDFRAQGEKGNAGNEYKGSAGIRVPKNDDEYNEMLKNEPDPKRQVEIQDSYAKVKGWNIKI